METVTLALRVGLSLACVLGLVWLFSKGALKAGGRAGTGRGAFLHLARQSLSRTSSVAVVQVGERALVLGVTEQHVTLLTEADAAALVAPQETVQRTPVETTEVRQVTSPALGGPRSALAGSALSPATWTQAIEALRERSIRR
jgi:flagellar protein FliO/FliZ